MFDMILIKKNFFLIACFLPFICIGVYAQQTGKWGDQGDGTFRNPVIAGDYSDPDMVRVGNDYYMVSSTFESYPGVTVLHSKDLINWTTIGAALKDLVAVDSAYSYAKMNRYNQGAYAPTINYHNNRFYIFVNLYTDGFYVATADNPAGPWKSEYLKDKNGRKLRVKGWTDPCPFWDEDGKAYLASSHPGREYWYSYLFQMSSDGSMLLDADSTHMAQSGIQYLYPNGGTLFSPYHSSEGNRIFKRNGYYYLQHIEFTNRGHGEGTYILRSKNIYGTFPDRKSGIPGNIGDYELFAVEKVTDRAHLRVPGQGGYVTTPDGRWFWMGQFTRDASCGRSPVLVPVTWINDWPVIGVNIKDMQGETAWQLPKPIEGYPIQTPCISDEFNCNKLASAWSWNHQPRNDKWSLAERKGWLRLKAFHTVNHSGFFKAGNTLNQRHFRTDTTIATIKFDISKMADGQKAGLAHFNGGKQYGFLAIEQVGNSRYLIYEENGKEIHGDILRAKIIYLKSTVLLDDKAHFSYSVDGVHFIEFGNSYKVQPGNFRGDMIGIFTYNNKQDKGQVDVDWFHYDIKNK